MNICFFPFINSKSHDFKITTFFQNHTIFKITLFTIYKFTRFQNHIIYKITRFSKSHYLQNHVISKITLFQKSRYFKNHIISKITRFQNHAIFLGFLIIFKTSVFFKNSPFKVHFGIPRLTICKKAVFSVQVLGFRL